jgi:hypothetical protein
VIILVSKFILAGLALVIMIKFAVFLDMFIDWSCFGHAYRMF